MSTGNIPVSEADFIAFLGLATKVRSLEFSTNDKGSIWPSAAYKGATEDVERIPVEGQSSLLDKVARLYRSSPRPEGGKFRVDLHGGYCLKGHRYFVEWIKSEDLRAFENTIAESFVPPASYEFFAQLAKKRLA